MKLDIILPVNNPNILNTSELEGISMPENIECSIRLPQNNLLEITSKADENTVIPSIIEAVKQSEEEGYDAALVYCFGEPGVKESQSEVNIPVLGIANPSMYYAAMLSEQFTVIASLEAHCPLINILVEQLGLAHKMSKPFAVGISPKDFDGNDEVLIKNLIQHIKPSLDAGVRVFILGCGSMQSKSGLIKRAIKEELGVSITVINPLEISIYMIYSLFKLR